MARSDEAEWWFTAVYQAVQEIPHGKVTSYGHIARLLGRRAPLRDRACTVPKANRTADCSAMSKVCYLELTTSR